MPASGGILATEPARQKVLRCLGSRCDRVRKGNAHRLAGMIFCARHPLPPCQTAPAQPKIPGCGTSTGGAQKDRPATGANDRPGMPLGAGRSPFSPHWHLASRYRERVQVREFPRPPSMPSPCALSAILSRWRLHGVGTVRVRCGSEFLHKRMSICRRVFYLPFLRESAEGRAALRRLWSSAD